MRHLKPHHSYVFKILHFVQDDRTAFGTCEFKSFRVFRAFCKNVLPWLIRCHNAAPFSIALNYDLNGNILNLARTHSAATMDNMSYSYLGNKITAIADQGDAATGFLDGASLSEEYLYDENGNMIRDENKKISITYNHLNLPTDISFDNGLRIKNYYLADGSRYKREKYTSNTFVEAYIYSGAYTYENKTSTEQNLHFTTTGNGRIVDNNSAIDYEYFFKDHLGNTRTTYKLNTGSLNLTQDNHYYAFGLKIEGLSSSLSTNRTSYNGKELDKDLNWYHYGARFYDPAVGRWWVVDAAEEFNSPYIGVGNNPIVLIDPDGNDIWYFDSDGTLLWIQKHKEDRTFRWKETYEGGYDEIPFVVTKVSESIKADSYIQPEDWGLRAPDYSKNRRLFNGIDENYQVTILNSFNKSYKKSKNVSGGSGGAFSLHTIVDVKSSRITGANINSGSFVINASLLSNGKYSIQKASLKANLSFTWNTFDRSDLVRDFEHNTPIIEALEKVDAEN